MRVRLDSLKKTYQDAHLMLQVVEDLTYEFPSGVSTAILGKSGVGKSTLLHMIGGLDTPTSGEIRIGEVVVNSLGNEALTTFRGNTIGFVFQFHHLLHEFTAQENVAMPLVIAGMDFDAAKENAGRLLDRVGLGPRLRHLPSQLSGGEQQRVAIARSVVSKPGVLLADEPTGNLDSGSAAEVRELLLTLPREYGCTLIVVTHSEELASKMQVVVEMVSGGDLRAFEGTRR